jgi:hypothetical protein
MEIKAGDRVVCVDLDILPELEFAYTNSIKYLVLNKIYTIINNSKYYCILYEIDSIYGGIHIYSPHRFKLLSEVRKEKIKTLKNAI